MQNLYVTSVEGLTSGNQLTEEEVLSVYYHALFDYPLNISDLIKWQCGKFNETKKINESVVYKNGYFYLEGRDGIVYKRILRKRISSKKLLLAKKAARIIGLVPTVKMVAVTGSLSMGNSTDDSDIDFMVITNRNSLWLTRLVILITLQLLVVPVRKSKDREQKDKLCLNMWLEEDNLVWKRKERNLYTAHEIAQILPLINKDNSYERFLIKNKWILKFWPNSVRISNVKYGRWNKKSKFNILNSIFFLMEQMAYKVQYLHMKSKITRETVTKTRALFHPQDWGEIIMRRLRFSS